MANLVCGIKKFTTPKGRKGWITTDNRRWKIALLANEWQKRLNKSAAKKAVKVLAGEPKKIVAVRRRRKLETVGASPRARRAVRALIIKYALTEGASNVVSMNRLLNTIASDKKFVTEMVEASKLF